jgi:D-amino-acid oxidase
MVTIAVIGSGVIGLTCALELALDGHTVRVVADTPPERTTSAVAGALWFPYHAYPRERVLGWSAKGLERFTELAGMPGSGVRLETGVMVHRVERPDLDWATGLRVSRPAQRDELPVGAPRGSVLELPLVTMPVYLAWLADRCRESGVAFRTDRLERISEAPAADLVVIATGLRSGALTGDAELVPSRGQVVRVTNPPHAPLTHWMVDGDDPTRLTYVMPHGDVVVCGGTDVDGEWGTHPDPTAEAAILRRVRAAVPALQGARVLSRAVGLRPGAPEVRLARADLDGREVITCYGHGGAGVTLSWGCAAEVSRLVSSS